jgi:hypothetical protein
MKVVMNQAQGLTTEHIGPRTQSAFTPTTNLLLLLLLLLNRLCGLVVRVPGCRHKRPGFDFLSSSGSGTGFTQPREDK